MQTRKRRAQLAKIVCMSSNNNNNNNNNNCSSNNNNMSKYLKKQPTNVAIARPRSHWLTEKQREE